VIGALIDKVLNVMNAYGVIMSKVAIRTTLLLVLIKKAVRKNTNVSGVKY